MTLPAEVMLFLLEHHVIVQVLSSRQITLHISSNNVPHMPLTLLQYMFTVRAIRFRLISSQKQIIISATIYSTWKKGSNHISDLLLFMQTES